MKYLKNALLVWILCTTHALCAQHNYISDQNVTDRVETEMAWQLDIPADQIDVSTQEGIVMLGGTVNNLLAKEKATTLTGAVRGVRGVVNQIKVQPPTVNDAELQERIMKNIFKDPAADSYEVDVFVDNGRVRLTGTVQSWQEKKLTEYSVKRVKGVQEVESQLDMEPAHDRLDNEIKREIAAAIQNDIRLYMSPVKVEVENGRVKLLGSVGSLNDQNLAVNYAWTYGVQEVDISKLDIDPWIKSENLRDKKYPVVDDFKIQKAIEDAFMYDPRVMSTQPTVRVQNGVVVLNGRVGTLEAKRAAGADARNIVGVAMVKNNLKVRADFAPNDEALSQRVKAAIVDHPEVNLQSIGVEVSGGIVYLSGNVRTAYERAKAEEATAKVVGVVRIVNQIDTIYATNHTPHPFNDVTSIYYPNPFSYPDEYYGYPLTDAQISQNIQDEWWWESKVDNEQLSVEVEAGVATLSGTVNSWQEMDAAVRNAFEGGAKSVVNKVALKRVGKK